jgi:hypothetical protein
LTVAPCGYFLGMLTDLLATHPVSLPPGRVVRHENGGGEALWLSDGPAAFPLWQALAEARTTSGLAPILAAPLSSRAADATRPWEAG